MKQKIKDFFKKNINIYKTNIYWIISPLLVMDILMFLFTIKISYYRYFILSPLLFTLTWIILFIGISLSFKKYLGKILYIIFNLIFMAFYLINNVYYSMTNNFFDFSLLESASEGSPYILVALKNCNILVYLSFIIIIIFFIIGLKKYPMVKKNNYKLLWVTIITFIILHTIIPITYGFANKELTWSSWRNPKNIYNSFNDNNKSMKITGLYEYTFRNFYVTYLRQKNVTEDDLTYLDNEYQVKEKTKNNYTGLFKNKNLILIQLEGTDNWLINENDTPTIYKLMNEGINFNKHYSYYNGGGSTFNSELAVNTGLITPLSFNQNAYSFNKNYFPYSLAHLFKGENYSVNAFHMNTGEFYARTINYENWGYDHYYGLIDEVNYNDNSYMLDRELILNTKFNELMMPKDTLFVDYVIAYSGHLPFDNTNKDSVCKLLSDLDQNTNKMNEEECIRRQAKETDYMINLLIENLKEKDLIDNTIIVIFTDHYLYTIEDTSILDRYKDTKTNLINQTPWLIWSNDITKKEVNEVTSQLNILPTVLNLFGFTYNENNYIGKDALDPNYKGLVFFPDYSWYDGNAYTQNGIVTNKAKISKEKLEQTNELVNNLAKKNDLTLKIDYFKKIKNNS